MAALEAARRNGELNAWRRDRALPEHKLQEPVCKQSDDTGLRNPPESVGWGNEALPKHERLEPQSDPILRMGVTPERSRREFQVGPSEASIPIQDRLNPWVN